MKLKHRIPLSRANGSTGFTLVELLISVTISVFVIGAIVALCIISAQNFAATSNYVQMNDQSRNAVDRISREIRSASALISYSLTDPKYLLLTNATDGTTVIITNDITTGNLILKKTGQMDQTLLTGLAGNTNISFQLFDRAPTITTNSLSFGSITNIKSGQLDPNFCKVINLSWVCQRTILGSKMNTEVVQTAQVVLRNQVSQ
jgi:hypothetical protein